MKDLQTRLEESESNSMKGGKRVLQKLEQRIQELENALVAEQRSHLDTQNVIRKNEKRIKELESQVEEDAQQHTKLQETIDQLNSKLKLCKKQTEDAEEIAAINLAKFRKLQTELEEAQERADISENQLNKARAKSRSTASSIRSSPAVSIHFNINSISIDNSLDKFLHF